jgi:SAM-dependent methyltransferase
MAESDQPQDIKERLRQSYNTIAPKYNEWTKPHFKDRMNYLDQLIELLSLPSSSTSSSAPPVRVAELGCGCGIPVAEALLRHPNIHYTGNDLSDAQIAIARENLAPLVSESSDESRISLNVGDMNSLDFAPGSLDAVLGFYSIIHLPREEQTELLGKIHGWLKPGGYLLANFSNEDMEKVVMKRWLADGGWMYWSGWGADKTQEVVREAGFEVVVGEVTEDVVDASFLWVIARKK